MYVLWARVTTCAGQESGIKVRLSAKYLLVTITYLMVLRRHGHGRRQPRWRESPLTHVTFEAGERAP